MVVAGDGFVFFFEPSNALVEGSLFFGGSWFLQSFFDVVEGRFKCGFLGANDAFFFCFSLF